MEEAVPASEVINIEKAKETAETQHLTTSEQEERQTFVITGIVDVTDSSVILLLPSFVCFRSSCQQITPEIVMCNILNLKSMEFFSVYRCKLLSLVVRINLKKA